MIGDNVIRICPLCDKPRGQDPMAVHITNQNICRHSLQEIRATVLEWDARHMERRKIEALEGIHKQLKEVNEALCVFMELYRLSLPRC